VINILLSFFTIISLSISTIPQDLEKAFLQEEPKILYNLLSTQSYIQISLPDPISFYDQLSHEQTYFFFKNIFSSYITFEFHSERPSLSPEEKNFILKTRWSFKDKKSNNQYVFHVFFYLTKEKNQKKQNLPGLWKITEIKADKI